MVEKTLEFITAKRDWMVETQIKKELNDLYKHTLSSHVHVCTCVSGKKLGRTLALCLVELFRIEWGNQNLAKRNQATDNDISASKCQQYLCWFVIILTGLLTTARNPQNDISNVVYRAMKHGPSGNSKLAGNMAVYNNTANLISACHFGSPKNTMSNSRFYFYLQAI